MKNLVQINILIKRMLCRPAMIAVLMLIPMALILVHVLPEKSSPPRSSQVYLSRRRTNILTLSPAICTTPQPDLHFSHMSLCLI